MIERVIIIDDEPATRFIMKLNVKQIFQQEAICFENILINGEILFSKQSTLFILDQNLLNGNGNELLEKYYEQLSHHFFLYFGKESDFKPKAASERFIYAEKSNLVNHLKELVEYEV
jgi:response regulator of citrate/malate metabolism